MRNRPLCTVTLVAALTPVGLHADVATPARNLLQRLGAEPIDCPLVPGPEDERLETVCGAVDLPFKQLKKAIESLAREQPYRVVLDEGWQYPKGYRKRKAVIDDALYTLRFDKKNGVLAVVSHPSCFDSSVVDDPGLYGAGDASVSRLEPVEHVVPSYPEAARAQRAAGYVVLQAIIEQDGSVGDICVVYSARAGYGFEQSARQALEQCTYAAPTRDGEPVRVLKAFPFKWWIQ